MAIITSAGLTDLYNQRTFNKNGSTVTLKKISDTEWFLFGDLSEGDSEGFPYEEIPEPPYIVVGNIGDYWGFARQGSTSIAAQEDFGDIVPYYASAIPGNVDAEDYTIQQVLYYAPNRTLSIQTTGSHGVPYGTAVVNGQQFNPHLADYTSAEGGFVRWDDQDNPFTGTKFASLEFWGLV